VETTASSQLGANGRGGDYGGKSSKSIAKKLDLFPKVDTEYTVRTDGGGVASIVAYVLILILICAECVAWASQNSATTEHISVEKSLGKKMRVNINVTFPALACEDLHVDVMDVAGDSQINIEDTMVKRRLSLAGRPLGPVQKVESNKHRQDQEMKEKVKGEEVPEGYCGPCYG